MRNDAIHHYPPDPRPGLYPVLGTHEIKRDGFRLQRTIREQLQNQKYAGPVLSGVLH